MEKVEISGSREIHVQIKDWKGRKTLDVRTYIKADTYQGYTHKGINIPVEKAKELAEAILRTVENQG